MQIHTYRVRSLAEALQIVRDQLGPDASLLHTRYIGSPLWRWLGGRTIEVTASPDADIPSRLPPSTRDARPSPGNTHSARDNRAQDTPPQIVAAT